MIKMYDRSYCVIINQRCLPLFLIEVTETLLRVVNDQPRCALGKVDFIVYCRFWAIVRSHYNLSFVLPFENVLLFIVAPDAALANSDAALANNVACLGDRSWFSLLCSFPV